MIFEKNFKVKVCFGKYAEEDKISEWDGEQKDWEGNKTKDLMQKWEEYKDGKTPFGTWVFMEGIGERLHTKSLTMISLEELLFNSTTFDFLSNALSCFIFSLASNSFLTFSSLPFLLHLFSSCILSLFPLVLF